MRKITLLFTIASFMFILLTCQSPINSSSPAALDQAAQQQSITDSSNDDSILPPTKLIKDTGTVRFISLEGGFYGIIGDSGQNYDPINLAPQYMIDGLRVKFTAIVRPDIISFHQWGIIIEITEIKIIGYDPIKVKIGEEFKLLQTQTAFVIDPLSTSTKMNVIKVTFEKVLSDSRCPIDVVCFWAGEAVILVKIEINNTLIGEYKMTTRIRPSVIYFKQYALYFNDLYPYPILKQERPQPEYVGYFVVKYSPIIVAK